MIAATPERARPLVSEVAALLARPDRFAQSAGRIKLRQYQIAPFLAITDSVINNRGLTLCVAFSRQSGKNETQAQIESYLLARLSREGAELVKASPTFKPQVQTAMRRLERALNRNPLTRAVWKTQSGYIHRVGEALQIFISAQPDANIVSLTATHLLQADEAQDILPDKWDKDIAPMGAAHNPTTVFWGTIWTAQTLLAREIAACREQEKQDGIQRVFLVDADEVGREVPAYAKYVKKQVDKLGRNHPIIKSQYYLEEIHSESGMFPPQRRALMLGQHPRLKFPPSKLPPVAFLIDVGGKDEGATDDPAHIKDDTQRNSTALTIVQVEPPANPDSLPTYKALQRVKWTGAGTHTLFTQIRALEHLWKPRRLVIDATGLGAGLADLLMNALGGDEVIEHMFTEKSKSQLGWDFLAVIETGRWQDWKPDGHRDEGAEFFEQLEYCQYNIKPGVGHLMQWGVPDGTRHRATGAPVHDDWITSAALCTLLDQDNWTPAQPATLLPARDPLKELTHGY
jgi:hypothetical protein